ncbi:diacylglycerol/lipid kinase family protein [Microbacterium rhizophilus]|uniref:diacylglycerol/lipid kinase family protein n=1 Tax=Microbacterium rhizophilus TaxID=3138934 RepID=UPI0031E5D057
MQKRRRVGLVVNPTAGGGSAKDVGTTLARRLVEEGFDVIGLSALSAEVALDNVRRQVGEVIALVVVGGDGMVHLGIQAVAETQIPLGVIPVGTGNDFAAAARIPSHPDRAVDELVRRLADGAEPRVVDLLHVEGEGVENAPARWVAGAVSAGLDAAVNARANGMRFPRGSSRYVIAAIREILGYRSWGYRLAVQGVSLTPPQRSQLESFPGMLVGSPDARNEHEVTWEDRGALVTAANGSTLGGGIRIAPNARIDDGSFELVIARDVGRMTAGRLFPLMIAGAHLRSAHLRAISGRAVTIESLDPPERGPAVYGDGERIGLLPVRVEVRRRALRLLA